MKFQRGIALTLAIATALTILSTPVSATYESPDDVWKDSDAETPYYDDAYYGEEPHYEDESYYGDSYGYDDPISFDSYFEDEWDEARETYAEEEGEDYDDGTAVLLTGDEGFVEIEESEDEPLLALGELSDATLRTISGQKLGAAGPTTATAADFTLKNLEVKWSTRNTGKENLIENSTDSDYGYFQFQLQFRVENSNYKKAEPGSIEIVLPAVLFYDRYGNEAGSLSLAVPQEPATSGNFSWKRVEDKIVITNIANIAAGSFVMIQGTFSGYDPTVMKSYIASTGANLSEEFDVKVSLTASVGEEIETAELTSNVLRAGIVTGINVNQVSMRATKTYNIYGLEKSTTTYPSYTGVPEAVRNAVPDANQDNWIYVSWSLSASITGDQAYNMVLTNTINEADRAKGAIMLGATGLPAVYNGGATFVAATDEIGGDNRPDTLSCYLVREDYTTALRSAVIWTAYPRNSDNYATGGQSEVTNTATVTVTGLDDEVDHAGATAAVKAYFTAPTVPVNYYVTFRWNDTGTVGTRPAVYLYVYKNNVIWQTLSYTAAETATDGLTYYFNFDDGGIPQDFTFKLAIRSGGSGYTSWVESDTTPRTRSRYYWVYTVMPEDEDSITDVYDENNRRHDVTISNGYSATLQTQKQYTVQASWPDNETDTSLRPTPIYAWIYKNGSYYSKVELNSGNEYKNTFWDAGGTSDTFTAVASYNYNYNTYKTRTGERIRTSYEDSNGAYQTYYTYTYTLPSGNISASGYSIIVSPTYTETFKTQREYYIKFNWTGESEGVTRPTMYVDVYKNGSHWKYVTVSASSVAGNDDYTASFWDDSDSDTNTYTIGAVYYSTNWPYSRSTTASGSVSWTYSDDYEIRTRQNWTYTLGASRERSGYTFTITNACGLVTETQHRYHLTFNWNDAEKTVGTRPLLSFTVKNSSGTTLVSRSLTRDEADNNSFNWMSDSFYAADGNVFTVSGSRYGTAYSGTETGTEADYVYDSDIMRHRFYWIYGNSITISYDNAAHTYTVNVSYNVAPSYEYLYTLHANWENDTDWESLRGSTLTVRLTSADSYRYLYSSNSWADYTWWSTTAPGSMPTSVYSVSGYTDNYTYTPDEDDENGGTRSHRNYSRTAVYDQSAQTYNITLTLNRTDTPYQYYRIRVDWDDNDNELGLRPTSLSRTIYVYQSGSSTAFASGTVSSSNNWISDRYIRLNDAGQNGTYNWSARLSSVIQGSTD